MKNLKIVLLALLTISILLVSAAGCTSTTKTKTLTVFHAGSLAVPFNQTVIAFQNQYPNITVQLEAAGSVESIKGDLRTK